MSAAILLGLFSQLEDWKRNLTTNHAKLDPTSADRLMRPLTIQRCPDDVAAMIEEWVAERPGWSMKSREQTDSEITLHLTRRTRMLKFTDDIRVRLLTLEGGTSVQAESQSRLGKADFGQNIRNLKELVSGLSEDR